MKSSFLKKAIIRFFLVFAAVVVIQTTAVAQYCVDEKIEINCNQIFGIDNFQDDFVLFRLNCLPQQGCRLCLPDFFQVSFEDEEGRLLIIDEKSIQIENVDIEFMESPVLCNYMDLWGFSSSLAENHIDKIRQGLNIGFLKPIHILLMEPKLSTRAKEYPSHYEIFYNKLERTPYFQVVNSKHLPDQSGRLWSFRGKPNFLSVSQYLDSNYRFVMAVDLNVQKNGTDYFNMHLWDREKNIILSDGCTTDSWNREGPQKIHVLLQQFYTHIITKDIYAQDNP